MSLKTICDEIIKMRETGFTFEHVDQILAKIPEEMEEVKEALKKGDRAHLQEELGDLIQTTLVLSDFLGFRGDEALKIAFAKLQNRYIKYMQTLTAKGRDLTTMSFEEKEAVWRDVKSL